MSEKGDSESLHPPMRFFHLALALACAFGMLTAVVGMVRATAFAQEAQGSNELNGSLNLPQNGGVDLSITKTHDTRFFVGEIGIYTIFVKNVGGSISTPFTVTITDTLPTPLEYHSFKGNNWNCTNDSRKVRCHFVLTDTLNTNISLPLLKIAVKLKPATSQTVKNVVEINDTEGLDNIFTDTTDISADLSITKSVLPTVITPTRVLTFTLQVKNNGPNDTTNVKVTDTLPSVLTFKGAKPSGQYNPTNGSWLIGNLAKDETKTLVITATVKDGTCGQAYTNVTQGLTSDLLDPVPNDNLATASFTVANTCITGIVVRSDNNNPIQSAKVQIKDSNNHVYTYTTGSDGIFTFTNLSAYPLVPGNAIFSASAVGFRSKTTPSIFLQPNIKNGPVEIKLDPIAQLDLRKSDGTLYIVPGETITYTIPITNLGVLNASNFVISDVLDSQLTFITYTLKDKNGKIPHTPPNPVNRVYTWTLSSGYLLTPTEKMTLAIRVKLADSLASGTNQIDNKISLRYNEDNSTPVNKTATDVSYTPNFEILQYSVNPTEAKVNERLTFSFRVYNRQPQVQATNVVFTNTFPSYLSFYSSTPSGSYNSSSRVFSVDLGTIAPNTYKDVTIIMTVNNAASSTQTLNNTATARFEHGGKKQWRSSNTVQYRILASSTLPGTGLAPPAGVSVKRSLFSSPSQRWSRGEGMIVQSVFDLPLAFWAALGIGILLVGGGLLAIAYSLTNKGSEWAGWARQMGWIVSLASLFFFAAAWWLQSTIKPPQTVASVPTVTPSAHPQPTQIAFPPPEWWEAQPDKLPEYPVPTPTLTADQTAGEVDDTPPTRLLIPKLGVDAIVKYVPFDGFSWLIAGLQNEIAWMGSTSWPGLGGNTALAGHVTLRNGADGPFRYLETLRQGDIVQLYTEKGVYFYRVQESLVVKDDDLSVVQPTQEAMLTLITCTGWNSDLGHYLERLVVRATLESTQPLSGREPIWHPVWGFLPLGGD
ncbi:MAG: hypothetical protein DDG59_05855 [Anaerolineae bacterium]|jgi:LPXTG-site transpeptidase (sortase) family protein|nr:MAG: hypothetical protein DDG59_05855 [Anaerolineae bacterium]